MQPRRVLLVDDEPRIVAGLQRLLRPYRAKWDVSVATSGQEALDLMAQAPFDVILSDMRMPGMDGAALLAITREKYPTTMRLILSGQTDADAALRVAAVAHQFLSKPLDPKDLLDTFERVAVTQHELSDARARAAVGGVEALPSQPSVCCAISKLLESEDASVAAIVTLLQREPSVVAKLFQIVNSAFFGARRRLASIPEAVTYLGLEQLKNLVLSIGLANSLPPRARRFNFAAFEQHSLATAQAAQRLAAGGPLADASFATGLLHDVGKLVMAAAMPDVYDAVAARCDATGESFEVAEAALGTTGHHKLGACLLDLWGIPFGVVEGILLQRNPPPEDAVVRSTDIVRIAHRLADGAGPMPENDPERAYLVRAGLLARFEALAAERADGPEAS